MFRQSSNSLSHLHSALESADGNIHLALQFLTIKYLKNNQDKDITQAIDTLLDLNANPNFMSEKFKDLVKSEFNCPDFKGGWSAIILVCRKIPTNETFIEMAAQLLNKINKLKLTIPVKALELMFYKIESISLQEKFLHQLAIYLPAKLFEMMQKTVADAKSQNEKKGVELSATNLNSQISLQRFMGSPSSTTLVMESKSMEKNSPRMR